MEAYKNIEAHLAMAHGGVGRQRGLKQPRNSMLLLAKATSAFSGTGAYELGSLPVKSRTFLNSRSRNQMSVLIMKYALACQRASKHMVAH